jgi:hypothetical protein
MTGIKGDNTGSYELKIYPVPFKDYLRIEGDIEVRHLEIFDLSGREIFKCTISRSKHTMINTSDLQPGFYQFLFTGSGSERIGLKAIKL